MGNWIKITSIEDIDSLKEQDLLLKYPLDDSQIKDNSIEFPRHPVITSYLYQILLILPDPDILGNNPYNKQLIAQKVLPFEPAPIRYKPMDLMSGFWWKEKP